MQNENRSLFSVLCSQIKTVKKQIIYILRWVKTKEISSFLFTAISGFLPHIWSPLCHPHCLFPTFSSLSFVSCSHQVCGHPQKSSGEKFSHRAAVILSSPLSSSSASLSLLSPRNSELQLGWMRSSHKNLNNRDELTAIVGGLDWAIETAIRWVPFFRQGEWALREWLCLKQGAKCENEAWWRYWGWGFRNQRFNALCN